LTVEPLARLDETLRCAQGDKLLLLVNEHVVILSEAKNLVASRVLQEAQA